MISHDRQRPTCSFRSSTQHSLRFFGQTLGFLVQNLEIGLQKTRENSRSIIRNTGIHVLLSLAYSGWQINLQCFDHECNILGQVIDERRCQLCSRFRPREKAEHKDRTQDRGSWFSEIGEPAWLVEEPKALTEAVFGYGVGGKAAVCHGDVEWLVITRLSEKLITELLDVSMKIGFESRYHCAGEELC